MLRYPRFPGRIACVLLLLLPVVLFARTWTDKTGNELEAEFSDFRNGMVILTRANGKPTAIAWERLSVNDQRYVTVVMAAREHGQGFLPKLVIGIALGLPPLIVGSRKKRLGLGMVAFLVCAIGGGFLGLAAALPACLISMIIVGMMPE